MWLKDLIVLGKLSFLIKKKCSIIIYLFILDKNWDMLL